MIHDVIVVGSGPAGAIAASILAAHGKSVLLADRQSFPRDKVCGDGLPVRVMMMLRELNVNIRDLGLEYQRVESLSLTGPAGQTLVTREVGDDVFSMTSRRYSFDNVLHQHALRCGAKFEVKQIQAPLFDQTREKVIGVVERKGKTTVEHEARLVIAADGASSAMARSLNPNANRVAAADNIAISIRAYAKLKREMPPCVYFYFHKTVLPGYAWIFPIANGYANVGVYLDNAMYQRSKRSLEDFLKEFLTDYLPKQFELEVEWDTAKSWPLPLFTSWEQRVMNGVMFIGDAGRFVNAITGGGIFPAMQTGMKAAHHALDLLDSTNCYPVYDSDWRPDPGKSLANARFLQRYIAPSAFLFNTILAITTFPPIKHSMLRTLSGEHY